ncbi:MAG: outer membrane beta-barrel protein [Syntrophobacteraceae bacterium]
MKRFFLLSILFCFVLASPCLSRAETYQIGANVAAKVDYFHFTDSNIADLNAQDGVYVGIEAYKQLFFPNFNLGMEVGWAGTSGSTTGFVPFGPFITQVTLDTDINYIPIEFNAKYVVPLSDCFSLDLGAGFSINHFDIETKIPALGSVSDDDWVWGGQFFTGLNYRYRNWLMGINFKYQLTEELRFFGANTSTSADNLRAGVQIGYTF